MDGLRITVALILFAFATQAYSAQRTIAEFSAPQLPVVDGKTFHFAPGRQERPTLFVFWASWCSSCRYEVSDLLRLSHDKSGVIDIIGVSVDRQADKALDFQRQFALSYPNIFDPDAKISDAFGVRALPTLVLVAPGGEVRYSGNRLDDRFKKALESL